MTADVLCLRPAADFQRLGVVPSPSLKIAYRAPDDPDVPALMKQARALVIPAVGPKLSQELFDNTTVKFIQVTGAGVDRVDLSVLKRLGISLANVPGGSNSALAEYVVTTASVLLRRFLWADAEIRTGNYAEFRARMISDNLAGLDGLTAGIVGLGVIGLAVAEAFRHRGCQICYYDPAPGAARPAAGLGARSVSLEELLKISDVITLHVPLLPTTQGLIGARQLAEMRPRAILIQASRGGIVDEAALAHSLTTGHLGGAAIDVYSTEPPAPNHPLLALRGEAARRILFTPHIAGATRQSSEFLFRTAWQNVERVLLQKEAPLYLVQ